jgi:putative ABC transport system permease protein
MSSLDRKLFRDFTKMKGQSLAACLVMACGLTMMIMTRSLVLSLESARADYYDQYRFAEVFCNLKRAPNSVRERFSAIPGVASFQTQVIGTARIDLPGVKEIADATIISIPEVQTLNEIFLRAGRLPEEGHEIIISEPFAAAHSLRPGDSVDIIMRGVRERLQIVGIGLSPENVYETRPGEPLPDSKRFGVFWMRERELAAVCGLEGAFNRISIDLAPGADAERVMAEVDRALLPYGGLTAYGRRNHSSEKALDGEIRILKALSIAFPVVFLGISTLMIAGLLARSVHVQREQIAQLRALGYSALQVGAHYLKFALVIIASGLLIGAVSGIWLGSDVVRLYQKFFRFPSLPFAVDYTAIGVSVAVGFVSTLSGVSGVVYRAMRLPPAAGMRPQPPVSFAPSLLDRAGFYRPMSRSARMAIRNLERRPWRASVTTLGLAMAAAIPIVPGALRDGVSHLADFEWTQVRRQDVTVTLVEPGSSSAFRNLQRLPAVLHAEPYRSVVVRLHFGHHRQRVTLLGASEDSQLTRVFDDQGRAIGLPADGLLISKKLAEVLGAKVGDRLLLEVLEGERGWHEVPLHGLIADYRGLNAIMKIDVLRRVLREGETISGAHLRIDQLGWSDFLESVQGAPRIASLGIRSAMRESFRRSTVESIQLVQNIYFLFAVMLAFGIVYTNGRISFWEQSRDLATLRITGFTQREVANVIMAELAVLTLVALPVGLCIGGKLAGVTVQAASTETTRLPLILSQQNYLTAVAVVLLSTAISFLIVRREVGNLDLLAVLRTSE